MEFIQVRRRIINTQKGLGPKYSLEYKIDELLGAKHAIDVLTGWKVMTFQTSITNVEFHQTPSGST